MICGNSWKWFIYLLILYYREIVDHHTAWRHTLYLLEFLFIFPVWGSGFSSGCNSCGSRGPIRIQMPPKWNHLKSLMYQVKSKENWTCCFGGFGWFLIYYRSYFALIFFTRTLTRRERKGIFLWNYDSIVSLIILGKKKYGNQFLCHRL